MTRTIIHLLAGAGLLAGLATSCRQESKDGPVGEPGAPVTHSVVITARIAEVVGTKVDIAGSDGANFTWSEGDAIAVLTTARGGSYEIATLSDGAGEASATFTGEFSDDMNTSFYSLYPASIADDANIGSPTLKVTLPGEYAIAGSMEDFSPLPMVAKNADAPLAFKHLGGVLRITCDNVPAGTKYITVTTDAGIQGSFAVTGPGTDEPSIAAAEVSEDNNIVQFTFDEALTAQTDGMVLNLPVPVGTYRQMRLSAFSAEDVKLSQAALDASRTMARTKGRKLTADLSDDATRMWTFTVADQQVSLGDQTVSFTIQNASGTDITSGYTVSAVSADPDVLTVGDVNFSEHTLAVTGVAKGSTTLTCTAVCGSDVMVAVATITVAKLIPEGFGGPFIVDGTEYYLSQGNMYKTETGYALYPDWTGGLDTYGVGNPSDNQEATGNMYFNWLHLGSLFVAPESPIHIGYDAEDVDDIDNSATPIAGCMLPTDLQWKNILNLFWRNNDLFYRSGSSVNDSNNCCCALVTVAKSGGWSDISGNESENGGYWAGLLLFPDGGSFTSSFTFGEAGANIDNPAALSPDMTIDQLNDFLAGGCVFLPAAGGWGEPENSVWRYGGEGALYWTATSMDDTRYGKYAVTAGFITGWQSTKYDDNYNYKRLSYNPVRLICE